MVEIRNGILKAGFTSWRAELVSLKDQRDREYVWDGNPEVWKGHAPLLFPIVGMVPDNEALINGKTYRMGQHGLAPRTEFELMSAKEDCCCFQLRSSDRTREIYPFEFCLDVEYRLLENSLEMIATVSNHSADIMPYSFGFHPGFCWPVPDAGPRLEHFLEFEENESGPLRRPLNGLFDPELYPSPIVDRKIALRDALFDDGAMMFTDIRSRGLRFGANSGTSLGITWENLPDLGIWTKPGAGYLCIEPWQGYAAPVGFEGELSQKPGILLLPPEARQDFTMTITVEHDQCSKLAGQTADNAS